MKKCIYSIGHSNRNIEEFIDLLNKYGIEIVVDVRRFPTSKIVAYRKENLEKILAEAGISYIHLEGLGGFRGGYEKWMSNEEWKNAYERLKEMAMKSRTAILCSEKLPFRCHRRYIARKLFSEGWRVVHIINDKTWEEYGESEA